MRLLALLLLLAGCGAEAPAMHTDALGADTSCHWTQVCDVVQTDGGEWLSCTRPVWTCPSDGGPAL